MFLFYKTLVFESCCNCPYTLEGGDPRIRLQTALMAT